MSVRRIDVAGEPSTPVFVGPGCSGQVAAALSSFTSVALLADAHVLELHGAALGALELATTVRLEPGEEHKRLSEAERVLDALLEAGLDRGSCLVSFGGGVTSDLAGLCASLYMRGIACMHVPTSLLAQVDASVGGKTGVNLDGGKNLAGTFHTPRAVYCDTELLDTLEEDEFRSGLGEVVKSAMLAGAAFFERLESCAGQLATRDKSALTEMVERCVLTKATVVACDPEERGARRTLNLGHTFGHAIEHTAGFGRLPHGVCVAAGLGLALRASRELGLLEDAGLEQRLGNLLAQLGLPRDLNDLRRSSGLELPAQELLEAMTRDKKAERREISLVVPRALGTMELDRRPGAQALLGLLGPD